MTVSLTALTSCRQDDENDFQPAMAGITAKTDPEPESEGDTDSNSDLEEDPPVKNGTHWRH